MAATAHSENLVEEAWAQEVRKLERDLRECAITILRTLAEAAWPTGAVEPFRVRVEADARGILEWILAKVSQSDLPVLNKSAIEEAVGLEVGNWVEKAKREFPPPWIPYAPVQVPPAAGEQQGFGDDAILALRKRDGTVFDGLVAHFSANAILITDVTKPIEAGDKLVRALPSGLQVGFVVDDPGYHDALGSIPAHFEVKAHRAAPIDSLETSDFWRRRRADFEELRPTQRCSGLQSTAPQVA
jgi:hypothetical protein